MDLSALAAAAKTETPPQATFTGQVVRADESGLWVVPLGEDPRHPLGPCRGGWTANGTRVPPGALVALVMSDEGPWAIGVDNPALAVSDATLAPFPNPSFEQVAADGIPVGWSDFWRAQYRHSDPTTPVPSGKYRRTVVEGEAAHGLRALRVEANRATSSNESGEWQVPAGSSIEISYYARATGTAPLVEARVFSNIAGAYAGPFAVGTVQTVAVRATPSGDWLRYRGTVTLPSTHTKANLFLYVGNDDATPGQATVWVDNVDADLIDVDPAAEHQDLLRRLTLTMAGGGARRVTAGGNVAWTQPLTLAGAGMSASEAPSGRYDIEMPPTGTVIPVHSSTARTSHTVSGGVIALNPEDALWYELPIGAPATSQPGRFHVIGATSADGYAVPPHWVLIVRRCGWSSTAHAPEYKWGDGRQQDPWRTPAYNAGWVEGTTPARFTKTGEGLVVMRGRVRNGTGSVFTLPAGYAPAVQHDAYVRDGAGAPALLTVTTAGVVTTAGNNTDHSIATVFPVAEQ